MSRTTPFTIKCTACHRILVNNDWLRERREYLVKYRPSLCGTCAALANRRFGKPPLRDRPAPIAGSPWGV